MNYYSATTPQFRAIFYAASTTAVRNHIRKHHASRLKAIRIKVVKHETAQDFEAQGGTILTLRGTK